MVISLLAGLTQGVSTTQIRLSGDNYVTYNIKQPEYDINGKQWVFDVDFSKTIEPTVGPDPSSPFVPYSYIVFGGGK